MNNVIDFKTRKLVKCTEVQEAGIVEKDDNVWEVSNEFLNDDLAFFLKATEMQGKISDIRFAPLRKVASVVYNFVIGTELNVVRQSITDEVKAICNE